MHINYRSHCSSKDRVTIHRELLKNKKYAERWGDSIMDSNVRFFNTP